MSKDQKNKTKAEYDTDTEYDEDDEPMYITLAFEDNTEMECEILGTFDFEGSEYIALLADDGTDDVYIYEYRELDDEEFELIDIEDDNLFQRVSDEFEKLSV